MKTEPPPGTLLGSALVCGGDDPLRPHLLRHLDECWQADLAGAFVLPSGVKAIEEQLYDLVDRGGCLRLVTGDYLGFTDPDALERLLDLVEYARRDREGVTGAGGEGERVDVRVFETQGGSFHPKSYVFHGRSGLSRRGTKLYPSQ